MNILKTKTYIIFTLILWVGIIFIPKNPDDIKFYMYLGIAYVILDKIEDLIKAIK